MLPEEGFLGQPSSGSAGSVPLSDGPSTWGAPVYLAIAALFSVRQCFAGLCSVGPFLDKGVKRTAESWVREGLSVL